MESNSRTGGYPMSHSNWNPCYQDQLFLAMGEVAEAFIDQAFNLEQFYPFFGKRDLIRAATLVKTVGVKKSRADCIENRAMFGVTGLQLGRNKSHPLSDIPNTFTRSLFFTEKIDLVGIGLQNFTKN